MRTGSWLELAVHLPMHLGITTKVCQRHVTEGQKRVTARNSYLVPKLTNVSQENWLVCSLSPFDQNIFVSYLLEQIEKATNVIVVGGGAVGIEMAGEVAGKHSGKFVTVIGAGKHLVTMNYGHKFQRKILSALRDRNINAITGKHGVKG